MKLFYLKNNMLEGPVEEDELSVLLSTNEIHEDTPLWNPLEASWIPCNDLLVSPTAATGTPTQSDSGRSTTYAKSLNQSLPRPDVLFALMRGRTLGWLNDEQYNMAFAACDSWNGQGELSAFLLSEGFISKDQQTELKNLFLEAAGNRTIDGYTILEELGRGGMGVTYRAHQVDMDRIVALKVLQGRYHRDPEFIERFRHEARMAARLNHPNIAIAFEVGEDEGQYFLSMEYVEGRTLADMLDDHKEFSEEAAIDIITQVCHALSHAVAHDMIHRDISARNLILKEDGTVKVVDMGLAKMVGTGSSRLTTSSSIIGTPAYMSPERALGEDAVDIRSDLYSLGCVLHQMLTGEPPLMGKNKFETVHRHINEAVPSVRDKVGWVSERTDHVIRRMTAQRVEERYQTPSEVI
ncbi:MAG: protein kinase domain-containing protein, partial [Planctomycetota bacterium]